MNDPVVSIRNLPLLQLTVKERWPNYQKCHFTSNCEWQFPRSPPPSRPSNPFLLILVHFANPNYTREIFSLCHCETSAPRTVSLLPELCALFTRQAIHSRQMGPKSISNLRSFISGRFQFLTRHKTWAETRTQDTESREVISREAFESVFAAKVPIGGRSH